jgi:hypothetical protein
LTASTVSPTFGVGLLHDPQRDARLVVIPTSEPRIDHAVDHVSDIVEPHRSAVAPGDGDVAVFRRPKELVVGANQPGVAVGGDCALGQVDRRRADRLAHLLQRQIHAGEQSRRCADADRRPFGARDIDLGDAGQLRQLFGDDAVGVVVHHLGLDGIRGQRDRDNRPARRVRLPIYRRLRQVLWQVGPGGVDCREHRGRGRVDVACEVELHGDLSAAGGAERSHFGDAGNDADLPFQGLGQRGRDRIGAGAWQPRPDAGRRPIDRGQRGDRHVRIGDDAEKQHAERDQGGRHRTQDRRAKRVHAGARVRAARRNRCCSQEKPR